MDIRLTNSKTRKKEVFEPIDPQNVRMYVCGPTVYDRAHIGNARPAIVFDLLARLLRHVYGAEHVTYVRNFTDVDDKINARASESGRSIAEITAETTQWYLDDMGAVGVLEPDEMPRATAFIAEMIAMIEELIAKGFAYAKEGHVLFRVREYAAYGRLSGRSVDDMIAGARVEVAPFKEDPMDFVLWKPSEAGVPGWDSPWGRGRPGWHIECSAMSKALLGDVFDIHGGGNDLLFPHHENEIAQSCCANGTEQMARFWLHNEMLQVEGKKMSKSLGNFFTVRDLLGQGIVGEVIRYVFLQTHYRKPMDWTEQKRSAATNTIALWHRLEREGLSKPLTEDELETLVDDQVLAALCDDLNTSLALTRMNALYTDAKRSEVDSRAVKIFFATVAFLGFNDLDTQRSLRRSSVSDAFAQARLNEIAARFSELRAAAMESKDFSGVDALKQALIAAGVEVRMSKAGVELVPGPGFDAAALEKV